MTFEFMKYETVEGEKYLGIATVKAYGKIVLRYKIVPGKEGKGFFPACASYKAKDNYGEDKYLPAFVLDSNSDKEELEQLIHENVKMKLRKAASVFDDQVPNSPKSYTGSPQAQQPVQPRYTYPQPDYPSPTQTDKVTSMDEVQTQMPF